MNDEFDVDVEGLETVTDGDGLPPPHRHGRRGLCEPNTWAKRLAIPALGFGMPQAASRLCKVACDPSGPPRSFAIAVSAGLDPALGPPAFDIRIGVGEDNYEWLALPTPPAGVVYIVQCHSLTVDLRELNAGTGTEAFASVAPTEDAPTLTP